MAFIEYHRAGVVTRTVISNFCKQTFPSYPNIHFHSLMASLNGTGSNAEKTSNDSLVAISNDISTDFSLKQKKASSGYDNIIEKLEKKYCGSFDPTSDSDSEKSHHENPRSKKRKAGAQADYYDMDDTFIDDSDNIAVIENAQQSKKMQTKYDGYFVSSGKLEVSVGNYVRNVTKEKENLDSGKGFSCESREEPCPADSSTVGKLTIGEDSISAPPRPLKKTEKNIIEWSPPSSVTSLIDLLSAGAKEYIQSKAGAPLKSIPVSLDPALNALDAEVEKSMTSNKICNGYLSEVRSALGGDISAAVVKSAIIRLRSAREAARLSAEIQTKVEALGARLREQVSECLPTASSISSTQGPASNEQDVLVNQVGSLETTAAEPGAIASDTTNLTDPLPSAQAPPPVEWKWICKWSAQLREQVFDLEQLCLRWVERENTFRSHLKATHKKSMEEADTAPLVESSEVTRVFNAVAGIAFAPPFDPSAIDKGGLAGIKKALSTEKTRRKNREKRMLAKEASAVEESSQSQGIGQTAPVVVVVVSEDSNPTPKAGKNAPVGESGVQVKREKKKRKSKVFESATPRTCTEHGKDIPAPTLELVPVQGDS